MAETKIYLSIEEEGNLMSKSLKYVAVSFAVIVMVCVSINTFADGYPTKPIKVMVPFPAGGSTDTMARAVARELTDYLGKNVVVANTKGGAGTVGVAKIAKARKDGYTLGVVPAAPLVNQPHMRKTPYTLESFDYICQLFYSPQALAVKPDSPFNTLKELVDYAKAHPGELSYGSPGPGSLPHLAMEQFLETAGIKIKHVPFTGDGPGITALLGGHVDMYMAIISNVVNKELKAVAVFSKARVSSLPDLPTGIEQGYEVTASWWGGIVAPKGIPEEAKTRLNDACLETSKSVRFEETLTRLGTMVQYLGPEDFNEQVMSVSETNGKLIRKLLKK